MSYFHWSRVRRAWIEVDHTKRDGMIPTLGGRVHPDPQHWENIRKQALERDGYRCVMSNHDDALEVHHRTYVRWGRERLEDVYVVCRACHQAFHQNRRLAG